MQQEPQSQASALTTLEKIDCVSYNSFPSRDNTFISESLQTIYKKNSIVANYFYSYIQSTILCEQFVFKLIS